MKLYSLLSPIGMVIYAKVDNKDEISYENIVTV